MNNFILDLKEMLHIETANGEKAIQLVMGHLFG